MAVNLSIKGVPDNVAERLRRRAEVNHRSLQGELMAIVERAAAMPQDAEVLLASTGDGTFRQGWKTVDQLLAERRLRPSRHIDGLPLAVDIIRTDRDSR